MSFLIYGAYGYTGRLIAREARRRGLHPTLAGRDLEKVQVLARELNLPACAFALDDRAALEDAAAKADLVLNCAGPFARTARPVSNACIRGGAHYLDITGEIEVLEYLAGQGPRAVRADVMLMPGVGFDVVSTDCLAAHLRNKQPEATCLELAVSSPGGVSRGTALTIVRRAGRSGVIRKNGELTPVPLAWPTRRVDFGRGPTLVGSIPLCELVSAWNTTSIPTIITYVELSRAVIYAMQASRYAGPLLRTRPVQTFLQWIAKNSISGPQREAREQNRSFVWGKATTEGGASAQARLSGPGTYTLTTKTALAAVEEILHGGSSTAGFQTPGNHFGPDFILSIDDTRREDFS